MTELLKTAYNTEKFKENGHQLIDILTRYLQNNLFDNNDTVIKWKEPNEQLEFWKSKLIDNSGTSDLFSSIISNSIHVHNTKYLGHQISPPVPVSALAGLISSLLNNGSAIYEMGATSVVMEKIIIDNLCKKIGYNEKADGFLTSGGTLANLTALLAARQAMIDEDIWENGQQTKLAVMVSEEAHYCIDRAVRIMGWGSEGIIKIPVTNEFVMQTDLLENYYQKAIEKGIKVIAVVGSACSTSTGKYDNISDIAKFCTQKKLWFHVDGAHGGAATYSKKYKYLLEGIEKADSIVIDFHKMLMTPSITTALIFKNGNVSYNTFSQKAQYLWESADEQEWYNLARRTFECTKLMMSIQIYSIIHSYGNQLFDDFVTTLYDLGKTFAKLITKNSNFELALIPDSNIVCFRYIGNNLNKEELNEKNNKIRKTLTENGEFYIVQTKLKGLIYLRVTIMNPFTTGEELNLLLNKIEMLANSLKTLLKNEFL